MKEFNRPNIQLIRTELEAAFKVIAEKHGIALALKSIRFEPSSFTAKLEAHADVQSGTDARLVGLAKDFKLYATGWGLNPDSLGKKFELDGKEMEIVGIKARARTQPVVLKDSTGKLYSASPEMVNARLKYYEEKRSKKADV